MVYMKKESKKDINIYSAGRVLINELLAALEWGTRNMVGIAMACASAGIDLKSSEKSILKIDSFKFKNIKYILKKDL